MAHRGRKNADDVLAAALASGLTIAKAAKRAGVSERTAQRRLKDAAFRELVGQCRSEMIGGAMGRLADGLTDAANTLRKLLKAKGESVRLGASRAMIEMTVKLRDSIELEGRVAELERIANHDGADV